MKVYVVTKALPLQEEIYVTVTATAKAAEKYIRKDFPNARKDVTASGVVSFLCKGAYSAIDRYLGEKRDFLMFVHAEDI